MIIRLLVSVAAVTLAACSSSAGSEGCTKDTDCASGRICGGDGRCVDRDSRGASADTTMMTLVEACSGSLSCTVNSTVNGIDHTTASLDRVDDHCYWTNISPYDGSIHQHELLPDGTVDGHDAWKSDSSHLVVTFGGGGLVFDCQ